MAAETNAGGQYRWEAAPHPASGMLTDPDLAGPDLAVLDR